MANNMFGAVSTTEDAATGYGYNTLPQMPAFFASKRAGSMYKRKRGGRLYDYDGPNSREVYLDPDQINAASNFILTNPVARAARESIQNKTIENKIDVYYGSEKQTLLPLMEGVLRRHWKPFLADIMDLIWTVGIAYMTIKPLPNGIRVPIVPKPPSYFITLEYIDDHDRQVYRFYKRMPRNKRPRSSATGGPSGRASGFGQFIDSTGNWTNDGSEEYVWVWDEDVIFLPRFHEPTASGKLTSPVVSLLYSQLYISWQEKYNMVAHKHASNPTYYLEVQPIKEPEENLERLRYGTYGGATTNKLKEELRYERDNDTILEILRHGRKMDDLAAEETAGDSLRSVIDFLSDDPNRATTKYPLPVGTKIANAPKPARLGNYVEEKRMIDEKVVTLFGVSMSELFSSSKGRDTVKEQAEARSRRTDETVRKWLERLGDVMTEAFKLLYAPDDQKWVRSRVTRTLVNMRPDFQKRADLLQRKVSEIADGMRVRVALSATGKTPMENLARMYAYKVIDFNTFREQTLRNSSLPVDVQNGILTSASSSTKDPWDGAMRAALLMGTETKTLNNTPLGMGLKEKTAQDKKARQEKEREAKAKTGSSTKSSTTTSKPKPKPKEKESKKRKRGDADSPSSTGKTSAPKRRLVEKETGGSSKSTTSKK